MEEETAAGPAERRGGSRGAMRAALTRTYPAGPAHWGGERPCPVREEEPVDVAGGPPGPGLPPTG
ncbi:MULTISPECIES: calcium-binding protein [Nocardiopsis]|uniref:Calcium-binding protein n=1 Tax=Nocardiopsis changdeensis TaxID=2831969 RepID=A0ABX8BVV1_9ACTN|nr:MULTISPECIES: calcium-binding protein [Nocardiopsis]QUX26355.1 calcium-binding protein [Nocardiopsis changdeensis]QYX40825.1 calcium-binding protein [Nocardiopsis sp. MT53]